MTHDDRLLIELGDKGCFVNAAVPSLTDSIHSLNPDKSELVSIIVSPKMQSEGHVLRQRIVSLFGSSILQGHIFGVTHRPLPIKVLTPASVHLRSTCHYLLGAAHPWRQGGSWARPGHGPLANTPTPHTGTALSMLRGGSLAQHTGACCAWCGSPSARRPLALPHTGVPREGGRKMGRGGRHGGGRLAGEARAAWS
jgi:hypothetical protein